MNARTDSTLNPAITVLMPVHNGEKYIGAAIDSVLAQTRQDYELLIINDGSNDRSVDIIGSYADPRIRLVHNDSNQGIARSLNHGLDMARGRYVARLDCDDICAPERLEKLTDFMDRNPEIGVCGSFIRTIGAGDHTWSPPSDDRRMRCRLLFESCILHPSAMLRMDMVNQHRLRYDPEAEPAEDFDFWVRCSTHMELANYPEVLLQYRIHGQQVGKLQGNSQQDAADRVRRRQLESMHISITEENAAIHRALGTWRFDPDPAFMAQADNWLQSLLIANRKTGLFPEPEFSQELGARLYRVCYTSHRGMPAWQTWYRSPLSARRISSLGDSIKLLLRCAVDHARR